MKKNADHRIMMPIVHFILTFVFERSVFIFKDYGDIVTPVEKVRIISLAGERIMGYIIAKCIAALFILFFWKALFYVKENFKKSDLKVFVVAGLVLLILVVFRYPDCFGYGVHGEYSDNLITFSYGLRFLPEYWHSAYSSLIYAAAMEVIPTPFSIILFQWLFLLFDIYYVFSRVSRELNVTGIKRYLCFLIFALPESRFLLSYAYRTEGYAILCMFFFSLILLDCVTARKRSTKELIGLCILGGFVSVWRTEGIILGFLGILILLVNNFGLSIKKNAGFAAVFICSFILLTVPQKIGDMKYYGSDYTIINSFAVIRNIFNRVDSNLDYPGAAEDTAAIEAVVPLEAIRLWGLGGYRNYNVMMGHADINQSIPGFEVGKAYSRAYRRLCLHNIKAYTLTQLGKLKLAMKFSDNDYIEKIHGDFYLSREYPMFTFPAWEWGENDLYSFRHVKNWADNPVRKSVATVIHDIVNTLEGFITKTRIAFLLISCLFITSGVLMVYDLVEIISKKKKARMNSCFFCVSLVMFIEATAIFAVMPAGVLSYFRTVYMCMFLIIYIRFTAFSSQYLQR